MKLFEYMSYRKPIICSNLPVLKEVMKDNYNCLLCEPEDVKDWEEAVLRFAKNNEFRKRIANQAFENFRLHYTWNQRAKKVI